MADQVIDVVFQPRPTHLQFLDFLVGGEVNFLLDAVNGVIEQMIFIEHFPEVIIRALEALDDVTMFREFSKDGMMQIHRFVMIRFLVANVLDCWSEDSKRQTRSSVKALRY